MEDLSLVGRPNGKARSHIDRVLATSVWFDAWSSCSQFILDWNILAHCPILVKKKIVDWGPKPFKVLDCWLLDKRIIKYVEDVKVDGWGAFVHKEKLKA